MVAINASTAPDGSETTKTMEVEKLEAKGQQPDLKLALKSLALHVTDGNVRGQEALYKAVVEHSQIDLLPEQAAKQVVSIVLPVTFYRYQQTKSHRLAQCLLERFCKCHPCAVITTLAEYLSGDCARYGFVVRCVSQGKPVLAAFNRLTQLLINFDANLNDDQLQTVVRALGESSQLLFSLQRAQWNGIVVKRVKQLYGRRAALMARARDLVCQKVQPAEPWLAFMSVSARAIKQQQFVDDYLGAAIPMFAKCLLLTKQRPTEYAARMCAPIVALVDHEKFSGLLLGDMKKAMLRSPEIVIHVIACTLSAVTIDLSKYADELTKLMAAQLISTDAHCREQAQAAIAAIAAQSSDEGAICSQITYLHKVINGEISKLSTIEQRLSVVSALRSLAGSTAPSLSKAAAQAMTVFATLLTNEATNSMVSALLDGVIAWSVKLSSADAGKLNQIFEQGLSASRPAGSSRELYLEHVVQYPTQLLPHAAGLSDTMLTTVQAALAQPQQLHAVADALHAALLLIKLYRVHAQQASDVSSIPSHGIWQSVVATNLFFRPIVIGSLKPNGLLSLNDLIERILIDQPCEAVSNLGAKPYDTELCLSWLAIAVSAKHATRQRALQSAKRISVLDTSHFASSVCHALATSAKEGSAWAQLFSSYVTETEESWVESGQTLSVRLCRVLRHLVDVSNAVNDEQRVTLLQHSLSASAHHLIVDRFPSQWWLRMLTPEHTALLAQDDTRVQIGDMLKQCKQTELLPSMCTTLACHSKEYTLLVLHVLDWQFAQLDVAALCAVTAQEVAVWKHADGQLYNTAVIDEADELNEKNMKRESKLYSYKEQMADLKLRKELAEKRRREGNVQLTPKQKEAMKQELAKESETRKELEKLYAASAGALVVCRAVLAHSSHVQHFVPLYRAHVLPLLQSPLLAPLAANCVQQLFDNLCRRSYDYDAIPPALLASNVLRVFHACCHVGGEWEKERLVAQSTRLLQSLHQSTFKPTDSTEAENGHEAAEVDEEELLEAEEDQADVMPVQVFSVLLPWFTTLIQDPSTYLQDTAEPEGNIIKIAELVEAHLSQAINSAVDLELCEPSGLLRVMFAELHKCKQFPCRQSLSDAVLSIASAVNEQGQAAEAAGNDCCEIISDQLYAHSPLIREVALQALMSMKANTVVFVRSATAPAAQLQQRVWVLKQDTHQANSELANELWTALGVASPRTAEELSSLLADASHPASDVRQATALSIKEALLLIENEGAAVAAKFAVCSQLQVLYNDKNKVIPEQRDSVGRVLRDAIDDWPARCGVADTLNTVIDVVPLSHKKSVMQVFALLIPDALNDRNSQVRGRMLTAAMKAVDAFAEDYMNELLPLLEQHLDACGKDGSHDALRQALVILMGTLAGHMPQNDAKIKGIVAKLIETLSTPSQQVQEAVARCLPPLVPSIREQAKDLSAKLLCLLLQVENYGERRGAAYGIAGLVKGLGIVALRELEIMSTLQEALVEKKQARHREGALLALQMLCKMLGKLFEPYVVQVLPNLLVAHGDQDAHVRKAAEECSNAVMAQLSVHGVKLVLPALLAALEEDSWRTKCGSIELLGAMAECAPRQLSSALPAVVPKLLEVLGDTHNKVSSAGRQALKHIAQVIKNPEVQALTPTLLLALEDPSKHTSKCLQLLLRTKFAHYLDAASLALLMPVITRAFDDRSTETRRNACHIIANIYAFTDQKDIEPYIEQLVPGLQKALMDPVPDIRTVAAKALGAMIGSATGDLAIKLRDSIIPWLKKQLISESSSVDRSGAAQGLCEVLAALGGDQLQHVMPDIMVTAASQEVQPHVRDGYIMMYIYLPLSFGEAFKPYLARTLPGVLKALADESEYVRESALRAGQRLIGTYCDTAMPLMLPQIELGMFDNNWRIRLASVQMLGELLFKISGVSGKMTTESGEDDTFGTESANKAIQRALGQRRNRVFAALYVSRSDTAAAVRSAAGHVWKVVVSNTPRTIKEILPILFSILLGCLASSSMEQQQIAARCLGELVRKMGERILVDVMPVLQQGLTSTEAEQRLGVCIALSEILHNTTKDMIVMYADALVPTVKTALCDELQQVREAAASTFDALYAAIASKAFDDILLPMLDMLEDEEMGERALDGLRQVVALKSRAVLPYLVPKLTTPPVNSVALAKLAAVAGDALTRHLDKVLLALLLAAADKLGTDDEQEELQLCLDVVLSVSDEHAISLIMEQLMAQATKSQQLSLQRAAARVLALYVANTKESLLDYESQLITGAIRLYTYKDEEIVKSAIDVLSYLVKSFDQRELLNAMGTFRYAVNQVLAVEYVNSKQQAFVPGLCQAKGIQPIVAAFREGILNGSAEVKEQAAKCLTNVITLSDPAALKAHVVNMTGPLIRVLGDRYPPPTKVEILKTLALLLEKVSVQLRPFLPQLTSTFNRCLQEPVSRSIRWHAAVAQARLSVIHPKPDTVVAELLKHAKATDDSAIKETLFICVRRTFVQAGDKLAAATVTDCLNLLVPGLAVDEDPLRVAAGAAIGALSMCAKNIDDKQLADLIENTLLGVAASEQGRAWQERHGQAIALQVAMLHDTALTIYSQHQERLLRVAQAHAQADKVQVAAAGVRACAFVLLHQLRAGSEPDKSLLQTVTRAINSHANDVKELSAVCVHHLARTENGLPPGDHLKMVVSAMVNGSKEKNSAVRSSAEEALVATLKLRTDKEFYNSYVGRLEGGARESLTDVYTRTLVRLAQQPHGSPPPLDDTERA